ncbi:hypothetical protein HYV43_01750 [Candidatus Micrarchaeota archaeon]|nr:hypothetical protein [Candidatus Micrarchaeota archaeon]
MPALLVPWGPAIHSVEQPDALRDLGANTASFAISVPYDESGAVDGNAVDFSIEAARQWIRAYRSNNVSVLLSLEPVSGFGEPGVIPSGIVSNPEFTVQYDEAVQKSARMAEEENVEFFSPMNEPDYKLGVDAADQWNPRMARVVQNVFSGKRVYKGSLYDVERGGRRPDFSGYDAVGVSLSLYDESLEDYRKRTARTLGVLTKWAGQDGFEPMVTEFGIWGAGANRTAEQQAASVAIVFDEGRKAGVKAFVVFDSPAGHYVQIKDSAIEPVVRENFRQLP